MSLRLLVKGNAINTKSQKKGEKSEQGGLTEGERFGNMNKLSGRAARKQEAGRKKAKKALDKEEKVC